MKRKTKKFFCARHAALALLFTCAVILYLVAVSALLRAMPWLRLLIYAIKLTVALLSLSAEISSESKCSWVFFILAFPIIAIPAYLIFFERRLTKKERDIITLLSKNKPKIDVFNSKIASKCNDEFAFIDKIADRKGVFPFTSTEAKYIFSPKEMLRLLSDDIRAARRFIFLQFYTVASGEVLEGLLSLLYEASARGVEVRIIYDDIGSLFRLPKGFIEKMKKHSIRVVAHASLSRSIPASVNNRNHRKIAIIDGEIGYTGGINIADEYLYPDKRIGSWKDSAVRIFGDGVSALTYTFLSDFALSLGRAENFSRYYKYKTKRSRGRGVIFDDGPLYRYKEKTSKKLILSLIGASKKEFTVTTPYLVCERDLLFAIECAIERGVRVRIVIPSRSDSFICGYLTRAYAASLADKGAEIYVYRPGFLHSKIYISDGKYLICGSVNLDYRSLCHNFENGMLFYDHPVIEEAGADVEAIINDSARYESKRKGATLRIIGAFIDLFAPLF